jgi:hypothetical protein
MTQDELISRLLQYGDANEEVYVAGPGGLYRMVGVKRDDRGRQCIEVDRLDEPRR